MKNKSIKKISALILAAASCFGAATAALAANSAPVAENLELCTYKNVSVGGRLSALDPDGDVLAYQVTTEPVKGTVELKQNGEFVYTPADGKKGKDYFGYKAVDSMGNLSQEGTVIIKISRKNAAVTYSDMSGNGEYYDAVMLAENDVFVGEKLGAAYLFEPERNVTRGEFLTMCMELADCKLLSGVLSTGFTDDSNIPSWEKSYISTAAMNGAVRGYCAAGGAQFESCDTVTKAEAAVMLNNVLGFSNVSVNDSEAIPTWAAQSVANLTSCNVIADNASTADALNRAQAAEMLINALEVLKGK